MPIEETDLVSFRTLVSTYLDNNQLNPKNKDFSQANLELLSGILDKTNGKFKEEISDLIHDYLQCVLQSDKIFSLKETQGTVADMFEEFNKKQEELALIREKIKSLIIDIELSDFESNHVSNNKIHSHPFVKRIKEVPEVYTAFEKLLEDKIVFLKPDENGNEKIYFDLPTSTVGVFFSQVKYTRWTLISKHCQSQSGNMTVGSLNNAGNRPATSEALLVLKPYLG